MALHNHSIREFGDCPNEFGSNFTQKFHSFLNKKIGESCFVWPSILREQYGEEAFNKFFELLEDFYTEQKGLKNE